MNVLMQIHRGLSAEAVLERQRVFGKNKVTSRSWIAVLRELFGAFLDPQALMLIALSLIYFSMGKPFDGWVMLCGVVPILGVSAGLELRTKNTLRKLKTAWQPWVHVIRDNEIKKISSEEVVPEDLVILEEGECLPADGYILESQSVKVDESSVTGESIPILKDPLGTEDERKLYAGTVVLSGTGLGRITEIGSRSQLGKLTQLVLDSKSTRSPLQKIIHRLVWKLAVLSVAVSAFIFALEIWRHGFGADTLVRALTVAMSIIPEEFPIVFTLFLTMGAWRLSKVGVLIRDLPSVETLGRTTVLCTDKTGTLTEGVFQLTELKNCSRDPKLDPWIFSLLACEPQTVDVLEKCIFLAAMNRGVQISSQWKLIDDYPFDPELKYMSHIWKDSVDNSMWVAAKGAFEGISTVCNWGSNEKQEAEKLLAGFTSQGLRVLALAGKLLVNRAGLRKQDEENLNFIGFLCFSDPIRPGVADALKICQRAGIDVRVVTGDDLRTAISIATQAGIDVSRPSFSGREINELSPQAKTDAYLRGAIFARVFPEQKFELVESLKRVGHIVAVTGDGVNDAPALKAADIGISMGQRATELARGSAKMILFKDDFLSLVSAMVEGRRVFANLERVFAYLITFHVPIGLISVVTPLLGLPTLLFPIQILLLELILHPVMALMFVNAVTKSNEEWIESAYSSKSLLPKKIVIRSVFVGLAASIAVLGSYAMSLYLEMSVSLSRSVAFAVLMTVSFVVCMAELNGTEPIWRWNWKRGVSFYVINFTVLFMVLAFFYFAPAAKIMDLQPLSFINWTFVSALSGLVLSWRLKVNSNRLR